MGAPRLRIAGTVLSASDARFLASFYERLLDWPRVVDEPGWVILRPNSTSQGLSFHTDTEYRPPTWPSVHDAQMIMAHLDIATDDVDAAVSHALACGATFAGHQPQDGVRVMLDPDGHPFCLFPSPNV
jgi:hypothetical protein